MKEITYTLITKTQTGETVKVITSKSLIVIMERVANALRLKLCVQINPYEE